MFTVVCVENYEQIIFHGKVKHIVEKKMAFELNVTYKLKVCLFRAWYSMELKIHYPKMSTSMFSVSIVFRNKTVIDIFLM